MNTYRFFVLFFIIVSNLVAQNKEITLEEIWSGNFSQDRLQSLQSLNNGQSYIVQDYNRAKGEMRVDIFEYKTGEKTGELINSSKIEGLNFFQTFSLSQDETKAILGVQIEPIYRRSVKGQYFIYNIKTNNLTQIDVDKIQEPHFSPDNSQVAFVKNNNVFIKNIDNNTTTQVTADGQKNKIINGLTDWVYEEEFAFVKAFEWSPDGKYLAYLKFNESEVPEFSMDVYGTYGNDLYPKQDVFKYPKAGEKNAEVSLHIYNVKSDRSNEINLGDYHYIPRLKWSQKTNLLSAQTTNRHQNELKLHLVNTDNFSVETILTATDKAYVDVDDDLTFLEDNSFIWTSEQDGWNHIYHYSENGKLINQVTDGNWEVTNYYGYDSKTKRIFYQSTETGSVNRAVYSIKINGKSKTTLADDNGINSADFSADFSYFINTFSNVETPRRFTLHDAKNGKPLRKIKDNQALLNKLENYNLSKKELSRIDINGNTLNMWMIKPNDFDPSKTYPLLMYQYSGPGSQSVSNSFFGTNDYWYQMLAQKGYIIACVDGRGTGYKGRDFKKITQLELGKYELEDQVAAAQKLGQKSYIDANRIGIWGWSYGGFMSSNAIFQANDVFSFAIAVAPVTSWRFYDTIYTERYMTTPQENASGYDDNSPISHVNEFDKGDYLLIHGSADDNVHVQNTMQLIEALVQANKPFDWRIYPDKNHGIYGGNTRLHLYNVMTEFLMEQL
ncbi:MAG: S9 family peptidase [Psychroflexus sp.]|nr:S9 family peptidase [Psychroflexus sp.]